MCMNVWNLKPEIWTLLYTRWADSSKHCRLTLADWIYILQTHTHKSHNRQAQDLICDVMHSRWMQSEVVNTGQWWSDEDKPDSYINIGQAFMLNNGSRFRSTRHCPTISFCRQTHTAANISDGTNKRNPELIVTPWYANRSWIDTITAPHFGNHPVWLSTIGLYQIHYGPPCLAPPYSTPTLNARREEINVAMETSRLLTGANFCLHQSDSIESWRDSSKLIAHIGADLKHLSTGYLNTNCICLNGFFFFL